MRAIDNLRGGSAPGHDNINVSLLKNNIQILIKPLTHLINLSLMSGVFPEFLKLAKVFPLFKSGNPTDKNNYRPISLLSVFSKILERIVKEQLMIYLNRNNILCECQYGF